jgi:hypothetical protein
MARRNCLNRAFSDAWAADEEGYIDVFFYTAAFAGREAVLRDMETIVCCVD